MAGGISLADSSQKSSLNRVVEMYAKSCENCHRDYRTYNKEKRWCNSGYCKNKILGISNRHEVRLVDLRTIHEEVSET